MGQFSTLGQNSADKDDRSLLTLPLVVGIVVVLGALAALVVSGVLVFHARAAKVEAERLRAQLAAQQQRVVERMRADVLAAPSPRPEVPPVAPPAPSHPPTSSPTATEPTATLKPGARLQAQRPVHWDTAEVVDILDDSKVKIRWLSGEPGEDVIASELVRGEGPPTQ